MSEIADRIDDVSTIPQMAATFLSVANDPDVTIDKLEQVLSFDPALSTRVQRLINSSAFAMQQRVTNLRQAISLLGLKQLRNLGIAVSVSQLFRTQGSLGTYNRTALWHHMVSVGICTRLNAASIRADVDDRDESVNKKVREAGMDWVPYVVVVGDEEMKSKKLTVTVRKKSQPNKPFKEQMTAEALIAAVRKDVEGKPFRPLYTPRKLSMKARYI